jgi:hypothetical protein
VFEWEYSSEVRRWRNHWISRGLSGLIAKSTNFSRSSRLIRSSTSQPLAIASTKESGCSWSSGVDDDNLSIFGLFEFLSFMKGVDSYTKIVHKDKKMQMQIFP